MKLQTIIDEIAPSVSQSTFRNTKAQDFINKYSDMVAEDVDWEVVCHDVETYGCYKYGFLFMIQLLREGVYHGSHADKLYRNLPIYEKMLHQRNTCLTDAMCGSRIEQQVLYVNVHSGSRNWFSYTYIDTVNPFIIDIFEEHLNSMNAHGRWCPRKVAEVFGKSLGKYENEVHSATDFNATMLFEQTGFYKKQFEDNKDMRRAGLNFVVNFYRWLVRSNPEHNYFENEFHMSDRLLFNNRLSELIERDFYFTTLNPANIPYGEERVCFILRRD